MARIYAITATEIKETGSISYKFMFDSEAPFGEFGDISGTYGLALLHEKDKDYLDPFKFGQALGESDQEKRSELLADAIGPNGTLRWMLNIFKSGGGLILASGVDDDTENEGLKQMLKEVPDCVLLIHRGVHDRLANACESLGIKLDTFHYAGTLVTS